MSKHYDAQFAGIGIDLNVYPDRTDDGRTVYEVSIARVDLIDIDEFLANLPQETIDALRAELNKE